jgi:hypothetical protein
MDADFPAAHSMDSAWFAVDKDGHVAFFRTGEEGALPIEITTSDAWEILDRLHDLLPAGEIVHVPTGHVTPGPTGARWRHWPYEGQRLVFLRSLEPLRKEIAAGKAYAVQATSGVAVVVRKMTKPLDKRLHKAGDCLACRPYYGDDPEEPSPAVFGLISYEHRCDFIAGPYGQLEVPRHPLHLDMLPPDVREYVGRLRYPFCFAETVHFQPLDYGVCGDHDGGYLTGDGLTIRENVAGTKASLTGDCYPELYDSLTEGNFEWLNGVTIEPPVPEETYDED